VWNEQNSLVPIFLIHNALLQVDPENAAIKKLQAMAEEEKVTTGKTTIGDEKQWNVFMRLDTVPVQYASSTPSRGCGADSGMPMCGNLFPYRKATGLTDPVRVMDKLREMKNSFRS
jgi:hydroxyacylglutathione hydrolase